MSIRPLSFRRRLVGERTLRLAQPMPWSDGIYTPLLVQSSAVTVTASATTHSVGSWSQVIANTATTETAGLLAIYATSSTANLTDTPLLLDIGTGASGSETVVVPSLAISQWNGFTALIPIRIPGSTRVAVRAQSGVASRTVSVALSLHSALGPGRVSLADRLPTSVDVLGTSTSTSVGTAMSTTTSTWTEIQASTSRDYQALVLVPSYSAATGPNAQVRNDLGLGLSGSELAVSGTSLSVNANALLSYGTVAYQTAIYGGFVPSGSRITSRTNLATNPERVDACVIGVPYV